MMSYIPITILSALLLVACRPVAKKGHEQVSASNPQQKQAEAAWDTLHNERFRIAYPSAWQVRQDMQQADLVLVMPREGENDRFSENIYLNIYQNPALDTIDLSKWKTIARQDLKDDYPSIVFVKDTKAELLGRNAWQFVYTVSDGSFQAQMKQVMVQLPEKQQAVVFTFGADVKDYPRISPIADSIMQSLKIY